CRPSPTRQDRTPVDCAKRRTCRARKAARYQWRITRLAVLFELLLKTIFAYSGPWPYFGVSCSREESQTLARNRCLQQTVCLSIGRSPMGLPAWLALLALYSQFFCPLDQKTKSCLYVHSTRTNGFFVNLWRGLQSHAVVPILGSTI